MTRFSHTIRLGALLAATITATYLSTALAGLTTIVPVTIDAPNKKATGSAGSARNSSDGNQYMFCRLAGTTTTVTATCNAHDSTTTGSAQCTSTNANIVGAVKGMSSDSIVTFQWDASGNCTSVQVVSGSYIEPKLP